MIWNSQNFSVVKQEYILFNYISLESIYKIEF